MPDTELDAPGSDVARQELSPLGSSAATHSLLWDLPENGLTFREFMHRALYDPTHGYYARGVRQVGRGGDFFTSVSVGPLFGDLLARRFLRWRRECGHGGRWRVLELGAHDGSLAADVLSSIATIDPAAYEELEYVVSEPLDALRESQAQTLAHHRAKVRWVADAGDLSEEPLQGIAFGNELLDALPFHVVTRNNGAWHEAGVTFDPEKPDSLRWCDLGPVVGLAAEILARIDASRLPDGYRTEVRTAYFELHRKLASAISHGMALWVDYGFARPEYYDPARVEGTLRTFSRHRAGEDPLVAPGTMDITAHVDFTAVAEDAARAGFALGEFQNQGAWLTREARDWMGEMEQTPDMAAIRQFQTLTHPAHLGARFHVIELVLGGEAKPDESAARRCGLTR